MRLKRKFGLIIYFIPVVFFIVVLMLELNFAKEESKSEMLAYNEKNSISYKSKRLFQLKAFDHIDKTFCFFQFIKIYPSAVKQGFSFFAAYQKTFVHIFVAFAAHALKICFVCEFIHDHIRKLCGGVCIFCVFKQFKDKKILQKSARYKVKRYKELVADATSSFISKSSLQKLFLSELSRTVKYLHIL